VVGPQHRPPLGESIRRPSPSSTAFYSRGGPALEQTLTDRGDRLALTPEAAEEATADELAALADLLGAGLDPLAPPS
jgi:hypothetical protein